MLTRSRERFRQSVSGVRNGEIMGGQEVREQHVAGTDTSKNDTTTNTAQREVSDTERRGDERPTYTVLLISACPFPANNGTSSRILRMGETLLERDHDVHVVTYHLCDASIPTDDELTVHRIDPSFEYGKSESLSLSTTASSISSRTFSRFYVPTVSLRPCSCVRVRSPTQVSLTMESEPTSTCPNPSCAN